MVPIIAAMLASVGGILAEKGLAFLKDIFVGMTDQGAVMAKEFIKEKTGVDITSKEELTALSTEDADKVRNTILDHMDTLLDLRIKYRQQDLDNTVSARNMNVDMARMGKKGFMSFTNFLALILILFMVIFFPCMVFLNIPTANVRFADTILGFMLGSVVGVVVNFYFGSSMATQDISIRSTGSNRRATDRLNEAVIDSAAHDVIKKSFTK